MKKAMSRPPSPCQPMRERRLRRQRAELCDKEMGMSMAKVSKVSEHMESVVSHAEVTIVVLSPPSQPAL